MGCGATKAIQAQTRKPAVIGESSITFSSSPSAARHLAAADGRKNAARKKSVAVAKTNWQLVKKSVSDLGEDEEKPVSKPRRASQSSQNDLSTELKKSKGQGVRKKITGGTWFSDERAQEAVDEDMNVKLSPLLKQDRRSSIPQQQQQQRQKPPPGASSQQARADGGWFKR